MSETLLQEAERLRADAAAIRDRARYAERGYGDEIREAQALEAKAADCERRHQQIKKRKQSELAMIHIAKKDLGFDEDTYRAVLWTVCRVKSSSALDSAGRGVLLDHFRSRGWKPRSTGKSRRKYSPKTRDKPKEAKDQIDKLRALWIDLGSRGLLRDGSERALGRWVKRQTGVDNPDWLTSRQAQRALESLKRWAVRLEEDQPPAAEGS